MGARVLTSETWYKVFDHLVGAVEQRVWNGKNFKQHHVCKPTFYGRGNRN
jgi:hypothetical protein